MRGADYCTQAYTVMHTYNHVLILITSLLVELLHQRELDVVCARTCLFRPERVVQVREQTLSSGVQHRAV